MGINTKWLEDFIALSEFRNFSHAAEARFITQPAFGRHIKALEEAVGQKLVDRTTHPISLTPAGKQFRTTARNLIKQLSSGLEQLQGVNTPIFAPLKIASPHSLSSPTLMNLMDQVFVDSSLAYSVDVLRVDFATQSLIEGESDILFAFDVINLLQPPYQNIPVGKGHFLLVSATTPDGNPIFTPSMDKAIPFLRYSSESYTSRLIEGHIGSDLGFAYKCCFESSMCQLHKEMVLRGKGVAWLPTSLIKEELDTGKLYAFDTPRWSVPYQIRLYRNSNRLSDIGEQFWTQLQNQINQGWLLDND